MDASHSLQRHVIELYQWSAGVRVYTKPTLLILPLREAAEALPRCGFILDIR